MSWQCTLLHRWLPEYPDGDLTGFWRGRLQAHLERCPTCREELAALREVMEAIQAAPLTDPGPEFWSEFSREMHLKLVQASQEGKVAPAPRSPWWGRLPYLVGGPALAGLLLWVAVGYLNPERPVMAPAPQVAKSEKPPVIAQAGEMAKQKSAAGLAEKMAVATQALPPSEETKHFVYVSKSNGHNGDEMTSDDESDDLDATLAGMTPQEKEAFLKKLSQHEKDGSCVKRCSVIAWA